MHEETAYGKVQTKEGKRYTRRVSLKDFKGSTFPIEKIADPKVKELVENRLYQYNNNFKEAFATELIHKNGNPIHSVRLIEKPSNLIGISKGHPKREVYKYYEAGGNHHLCIFEDLKTNKKVEVLTTKFDAAQRKVKDEPVIQKEKEGHKFLLSLKINDMLKLTGVDKTGKDISGYYRVQKLSKGDWTFKQHNQATKEETGLRISSLKTFLCYNPQKIFIDPIGQIKDL